MNYSIEQIALITNGKLHGVPANSPVTRLVIDSRTPVAGPGDMFCALSGATDGHRFIPEMYRRGVRAFLVSNIPVDIAAFPDTAFVLVDSVSQAIDAIAAAWRNELSDTVFVGITGSVGKTVVKELLYRALVPLTSVSRSPRSWNSQIGVPLSICSIPSGTKVAVIEAGIDRRDTMEPLAALVSPSLGILTPVTSEHDEGFNSRAEKIAEKLKLFKGCKVLIYSAADPDVDRAVNDACAGMTLIPVLEDFDKNAVEAAVKVLGFGDIVADCADLPSNRIDVHEGINDCVMLYDAFTADVDSLAHALDFMKRRATSTRRNTVILTDHFHSPALAEPELDELYRGAAASLAAAGIDRLVTIGPETAARRGLFAGMEVESVPDADSFFERYDINAFSSETILIFGQPKSTLSAIRTLLESPRHDTTLEVNLDSVVHNFNTYRSMLGPSTGLVAMVKASAYGLGAVEIAKTLQSQGASYLAVAVIDEGVELRRGGITMPIMVLNPITGNYKALFDYNLEPSVFSMRELDTLCEAARRAGAVPFKAHIKLDTGMHRVGFTPDEIDALAARLRNEKTVQVASVFSHLATADCLDLNDYTAMQLGAFREMSDKIVNALPYPVLRHVLNTAGIMRYHDHQYDMVRLGIGLYGVSPLPGRSPLRCVATLKSTIISLRPWQAGTTIGYGCKGRLDRDSIVATVPVGYADGVDRHLGNGNASFIVNGVECPTVGNICMDQCMIDVTDARASIGDEVEIFGPHMPVEKLAETLGTIPYEILTSVAPRVKRIYYRD